MEGSAATGTKGETPPTPPPPGTPAPTPPAPTPTPAPDPPKPAPAGETAAEKRIRELNDRMKDAERRAKEAEDKVKEAERAKLGDLERAQAERDEAKREAAEATARATTLERGTWARSAARELGFIDPEDAVAMVDLDVADTQAKVKNAVERLKESKAHLVGTAGQAPAGGNVPPPGFGNLGGSGGQPDPEVPVDEEGKPDVKLGLGRDILGTLTGRGR